MLVKTLQGHGHWVNTLALNTDFVLRTGPFDHTCKRHATEEEGILHRGEANYMLDINLCVNFTAKAAALKRYKEFKGNRPERLVSGSDDFTMFFWEPETSKKPLARMTGLWTERITQSSHQLILYSQLGHQKLVNHVSFSPDGRYIASASFDTSVKLWDGATGKFIGNLRGHVGSVYQVCWSSDSRMLLSGSKDSTLKVWDIKKLKIKLDLPGHLDEVCD